MKVKILMAILLTNLSIGERQPRSTVLTDESKRVLEHFDFSNFDKQEALNYLDRQRYENQIRGKRSKFKYTLTHNEKNDKKVSDLNEEMNQLLHNSKRKRFLELINSKNPVTEKGSEYEKCLLCNYNRKIEEANLTRDKRGHGYKRRHKSKINRYNENYVLDDADDENFELRYKKRKRKKKKKKRHYWNRWSEWSPCSVTCGRGRKIRWRKCIAKNCTTGELEMGEKTCQLPACNLFTKLLGL